MLDKRRRVEYDVKKRGQKKKSMKNDAKTTYSPVFPVAFCSLMAALGVVLMMTGGLIPVMTYCSPLLAGVLLIPVLRECGTKWAWMVWVVTAALSMILSADKEAAFFYLFVGYYPILKPGFDRIRPKALGFAVKLLFFAAAVALMYGLILTVLGLDIGMEELEELGRIAWIGFYLLLLLSMMIYDVALGNLTILYEYRLRPRIPGVRS